MPLPELGQDLHFPPSHRALQQPNGLLAYGGDLSLARLNLAYSQGIFPWYSDEDPILWWAPDPRCVFYTQNYQPSKSLRKRLKKLKTLGWLITTDKAFWAVIEACSADRHENPGTWITPEMRWAYWQWHLAGGAHSIEVWQMHEDKTTLIGGLYGVLNGQIFCGESMFSHQSDASKVAFSLLVAQCLELGIEVIDSQVASSHTLSLGAVEIPRKKFESYLTKNSPNTNKLAWPKVLDVEKLLKNWL